MNKSTYSSVPESQLRRSAEEQAQMMAQLRLLARQERRTMVQTVHGKHAVGRNLRGA